MLRIALAPFTLHFARPAPTSRGVLAQRQILLLRASDTDDPSSAGWGECGPIPGLSPDDGPDFARHAAEVCDVINAGYWPQPGDLADLPSFAFGFETALRDLATGGRRILWETPFASGEAGLPTHGLIWMDSVEGLLRQIEAKVAAGFTVIKMKIGSLPQPRELELLAAVRDVWPARAVELRLDANGLLDAASASDPDRTVDIAHALDILTAFARFDVTFLEQPLPPGHWRALADLCRRSPIPIALDEELIGVVGADARCDLLDTIQPAHLVLKPALLGGFAAAEEWIEAAEVRGIQWWTNSLLESSIGLNAICQWTSAVGGGRVHGLGTGSLFTNNIPSPVHLVGSHLVYDPARPWGLPLPPGA